MTRPSWKILKAGQLNIARDRFQWRRLVDSYHGLLSISWRRFFAFLVAFYLVVNLVFAGAYFACGRGALVGLENPSEVSRFIECFFFSVQTFATIGYGRINPSGILPNLIVTAEAFFGLLSVAMMTGLVFARFSRPTARVLFSQKALISTDDGKPVLVFRVANQRLNQISEARMNVAFLKNERNREGEWFGKLYDLKLQRDYSPMFALSWTAIHVIDEQSPLQGMGRSAWLESEAEILVSLTGVDETFAQSIRARHSYALEDVVWGGHFKDMISRTEDGKVKIDLSLLSDIVPADREKAGLGKP